MRSMTQYSWVLSGVLLVTGCLPDDPLLDDVIGGVVVSNRTTGSDLPLHGLSVRFDDGTLQSLELNESLQVAVRSQGGHRIELGGIPANCSITGTPTREFRVERFTSLQIEFVVSCAARPALEGLQLAFTSGRDEEGLVVLMNADGTGRTTPTAGRSVDVSPDGSRLLIRRADDVLYSVNQSGTDAIRLGAGYHARWSPDGSEIVFASIVEGTGLSAIFTTRADGTGTTQVTGHEGAYWDTHPSWSADGTRLAFARTVATLFDELGDVWVSARDGSEAKPLTSTYSGDSPVWSSDGRIAFAGWDHPSGPTARLVGIVTVGADGTAADPVLDFYLWPTPPVLGDWSGDGRWILYSQPTGPERSDIFVLDVDEGALIRLTGDGMWNASPVFR